MKKALSLILALVMCLSLFACGGDNDTADNTEPLSAIDQLTKVERHLFDALVKMITKDFFEPSAIRVLEVGDYINRNQWGEYSTLYGPDTVVVRLQGENRVGGTLNHYYIVCIRAGERPDSQRSIDSWAGDIETLLSLGYKGEVGDYAELSDNYSFKEDAADIFNIGRINKALKEYWEDMGF